MSNIVSKRRTNFEMEIDVTFHDEERTISYLKSDDFKSVFYVFEDLDEAAESLSSSFYAEKDEWDKDNHRFFKFIEGFGDFICDKKNNYKLFNRTEDMGDITIFMETELEPSVTYSL